MIVLHRVAASQARAGRFFRVILLQWKIQSPRKSNAFIPRNTIGSMMNCSIKRLTPRLAVWISCVGMSVLCLGEEPHYEAELVFPLNAQHNHAPGIVACPNGDLFVTWYRGEGERKADDVAVYAAWKRKGAREWTKPFVLADTPGFPDCNTALFVDRDQRLWLFYPTILANTWESCLTNFKMAKQFAAPGAPQWDREGMILLKPDDFAEQGRKVLDEEVKPFEDKLTPQQLAGIAVLRERLGDKLFQRLGWQPDASPRSCRTVAFFLRYTATRIRSR